MGRLSSGRSRLPPRASFGFSTWHQASVIPCPPPPAHPFCLPLAAKSKNSPGLRDYFSLPLPTPVLNWPCPHPFSKIATVPQPLSPRNPEEASEFSSCFKRPFSLIPLMAFYLLKGLYLDVTNSLYFEFPPSFLVFLSLVPKDLVSWLRHCSHLSTHSARSRTAWVPNTHKSAHPSWASLLSFQNYPLTCFANISPSCLRTFKQNIFFPLQLANTSSTFRCCSVTQLCPIDCSMPGFTVLHHLPEFAQTHVH